MNSALSHDVVGTPFVDMSAIEYHPEQLDACLNQGGFEADDVNRKILCDCLCATSLAMLTASREIFEKQMSGLIGNGFFKEEERPTACLILAHLMRETDEDLQNVGDCDQTRENMMSLAEFLKSTQT